MADDKTLTEIGKDFPSIHILSLEDHFIVEVNNKTYLIQVFKSDNEAAPWDTNIYIGENGKWKYVADFPWRSEKRRESTIRTTLSFLEER